VGACAQILLNNLWDTHQKPVHLFNQTSMNIYLPFSFSVSISFGERKKKKR